MNSDRVTAGSGRTRRLTERGKHLYVMHNKKRRVDILKSINLRSEHIQYIMATNTPDLLALRNEYKNWLAKWEALLLLEEELKSTIDGWEYDEVMAHEDGEQINRDKENTKKFKGDIEAYILELQRDLEQRYEVLSVASGMSRRSSVESRRSNIAAKLEEAQKRAELIAKMEALQQKQALATRKDWSWSYRKSSWSCRHS
jgi:uncharacterized protein with PIN domain